LPPFLRGSTREKPGQVRRTRSFQSTLEKTRRCAEDTLQPSGHVPGAGRGLIRCPHLPPPPPTSLPRRISPGRSPNAAPRRDSLGCPPPPRPRLPLGTAAAPRPGPARRLRPSVRLSAAEGPVASLNT